jgi:hypothetical protein
MESQSGKGDPSKTPASDGGKGDPSKSPVSDGGKGGSSMTAKPQRLPIKRPTQHATKGRPVMLLTNHFKVSLTRTDQILYHYDVPTATAYLILWFTFDGDFFTICFEFLVMLSTGDSEV